MGNEGRAQPATSRRRQQFDQLTRRAVPRMPWPFIYNSRALKHLEKALFERNPQHGRVTFAQRDVPLALPERWPFAAPVTAGCIEVVGKDPVAGKAGPPVLFLHGLFAGNGCWFKNLEPVATALGGERRVLAMDFLGAGRSSHGMPQWPGGRDSESLEIMELLVDQLEAFLEAEGIEDLDIVRSSVASMPSSVPPH